MNKVIKIGTVNHTIHYDGTPGNTCTKCAFMESKCPIGKTEPLCCELENECPDPKSVMVYFKEIVESNCVFTETQVRDAYASWVCEDDADAFFTHLKNFCDPEYAEYLRLKEKFE